MSESTHSHHHHHHHHKKDSSSIYKHENLMAIERKKIIKKWLFYALCAIAAVMFLITVYLYI
jgi:hypothetical protein